MMSTKNIRTQVPYLRRDSLYGKEKPYVADFSVDHVPNAKSSNQLFEFQEHTIIDAQPLRSTLALHRNGFCFLREKTSLVTNDADDPEFVQTHFWDELESILRKAFPEYDRFEYLDHLVIDTKSSEYSSLM
jgi:hypothetical protein